MTKTVHGAVHGKTIQLEENPGAAEGQEAEITIRPLPNRTRWGEGILRCAGALASDWTKEDDRILAEIHADRKRDSREDILE